MMYIRWIMFPNNTPVTQEKISKKATPRNNMSPIIPNHNLKETLSYTLFEEESSNGINSYFTVLNCISETSFPIYSII